MSLVLRAGTQRDAAHIARLADVAGEGLPGAYWTDIGMRGQDPLKLGQERAARDDGVFTWRHVIMAEVDDEIAGMILTHPTNDAPFAFDETVHPLFRPFVRLINAARYATSVNLLGVYPNYRRQKVATALVQEVEDASFARGTATLLVSDANSVGQEFCKSLSYGVADQAPVVKGGWETSASRWQLFRKTA